MVEEAEEEQQQLLQLEPELPLRLKRRAKRAISSPKDTNVDGNTTTTSEESEASDPDAEPPVNRKPKRKKPRNRNKAQGDTEQGVATGVAPIAKATNTTNVILSTSTKKQIALAIIEEEEDDANDDCLKVFAGKPTFLLRTDFILWGNITNRFVQHTRRGLTYLLLQIRV